jgi:hypothetical protein
MTEERTLHRTCHATALFYFNLTRLPHVPATNRTAIDNRLARLFVESQRNDPQLLAIVDRMSANHADNPHLATVLNKLAA